jgi:hypothetical protein
VERGGELVTGLHAGAGRGFAGSRAGAERDHIFRFHFCGADGLLCAGRGYGASGRPLEPDVRALAVPKKQAKKYGLKDKRTELII